MLAYPPLPSEIDGIPVFPTGHQRQTWSPHHIVVGYRDVTRGNAYGYHWELEVTAYPEFPPGRHGTSCEACAELLSGICPLGDDCGHVWDGEPYGYFWAAGPTFTLHVDSTRPPAERVDPTELAQALQACADALNALPPNPLKWAAIGPHEYGRWATEEQAVEWLAGHMERLAKDRNLGGPRQEQALANASRLRAGTRAVQVGIKEYRVECFA